MSKNYFRENYILNTIYVNYKTKRPSTQRHINTKQSGKLGLYTKSTMQAVFVIILCEAQQTVSLLFYNNIHDVGEESLNRENRALSSYSCFHMATIIIAPFHVIFRCYVSLFVTVSLCKKSK